MGSVMVPGAEFIAFRFITAINAERWHHGAGRYRLLLYNENEYRMNSIQRGVLWQYNR